MSGAVTILYQLVAPLEKSVGPDEITRRRDFLQSHAAPGITVDVRSVARGTASIESAYDAVIVAPSIIESAREAVAEGHDAVIIGCFSDPGIDALREVVRAPVVGAGMSAIHLAMQLGDRFSIISPNDDRSSRSATYVRQLGVGSRYASTRGMGRSVVELARRDPGALDRIADRGRACVEQDGADVLVLGCMSMAFLGLTEELTSRIGVPVVSPVIAALKTAEMMVSHGIAHSATGWPSPPKKPVLERGAA